ncbi:MAG: peptide ABC transporter permease [Chloroflexi bacterium]|nr:MAG: peptide ABC transporter permease [Chloroflexota bacterium]
MSSQTQRISAPTLELTQPKTAPSPLRAQVWRRFRRNPLAMFGLATLGLLSLSALFAPLIAPYDPNAVDPYVALQPPSADHWLGTDDLGRDVLSRLLFAGRVSLLVGLCAAGVAVIAGALLGALAGYYGRSIDQLISRLIDVMLALPVLPLALVLGAFTQITPVKLTLILAAVSWMGVARLVRGEFLELRNAQFTEAARSVGTPNLRIIFVHLLPNAIAPIIVAATLLVAYAILIESALSFLGFGLQPPTASWGNMLFNAQRYLRNAAWLSVFSGLLITLTVASINFVGDGLREAIDPRLKVG